MEKIVIIGSSGAGKTTLARRLGNLLKIKTYHLDRLFWERGWQSKSHDARIDILQKIVQNKQWVIEGTYLASSEPRLDDADTIIFLDIFPLICLWRVFSRHHKTRNYPRRDLPMECTDKVSSSSIWKVFVFPFNERRLLKRKLYSYSSKQIIWLRSSKQIDKFFMELQESEDAKKFSNIHRSIKDTDAAEVLV